MSLIKGIAKNRAKAKTKAEIKRLREQARLEKAREQANIAAAQRHTLEVKLSAEKIVDEATPDLKKWARQMVIKDILTIMCSTLHVNNKFGKKRLESFVEAFFLIENKLAKAAYEDDIYSTSIRELHEDLKKETGFDLALAIDNANATIDLLHEHYNRVEAVS